jgi:hypothetical protein
VQKPNINNIAAFFTAIGKASGSVGVPPVVSKRIKVRHCLWCAACGARCENVEPGKLPVFVTDFFVFRRYALNQPREDHVDECCYGM